MTEAIKLDSKEWHEHRQKYIGGSEVAALFHIHPSITRFELWHQKKGNLKRDEFDNDERVFWGRTLEPAIAQGIASKLKLEVEKEDLFYQHPKVKGMGASLDYKITRGKLKGALEIKNVDWLVFQDWGGEPPLNYMLQNQQEIECANYDFGVIGVLVGGNQLEIFEYERRPKTAEKLKDEISDFWKTIEKNQEPSFDFETDSSAIIAMNQKSSGRVLNTDSSRLTDLCTKLEELTQDRGGLEKRRDAIKAEIFTIVGDASKVMLPKFTIHCDTIKREAYQVQNSEYRSLRISTNKEQENV